MKADKISESGTIGKDGKLRLPMDRLNAWFAEHKCQRVVIRFEAAAPGSSACQLAYYYNYIIPTVQKALHDTGERMTEQKTDKWLMEQYPGDAIESEFGTRVYSARELTQTQMSDYLEWLKQFAAENLSVYIEDPKVL